ncbi:MAG: FtsK/SpoIIIE domain-containing protein, partial [Lentisphaeraceae bacterium]|nr:FtsK/SpoIIIE domain-containing protein [Lentisphaeraceae bacterium]
MSNLLKPSDLRTILSSLNTMLQDYSEKNKEISASFSSAKNELKSKYDTEKKQITDENQKKLALLEQDFLKEKELIDVEKEQLSASLQENIDQERQLISQSYDESSETARRHSREYILEKRKENEEAVKNLTAEHSSMEQLLNDSLVDCQEIKKLLKTFKEIQPAKDLLNETFTEKEDGPSLEEQMQEYDASPHFDKLEELKTESQQLFSKLKKSPLTGLFLKLHPALVLTIITLIHGALFFIAGKLNISALSTNNILISFGAVFGLFAVLTIFYKVSTGKRLKTLSDDIAEIEGLCELCSAINKAQLDFAIEKENLLLKELCLKEESSINNEVKDVDLGKNQDLRKLKDKQIQELQEIASKSAEHMETLANKQTEKLEELEKIAEDELEALRAKFEADLDKITDEEQNKLDSLTDKWQKQWFSKLEEFDKLNQESQEKEKELFPSWSENLSKWVPMQNFEGACPFGSLQMDLKKELTFPADGSFELSESIPFSIPALMEFPESASLLVGTKDEGREMAVDLIKNTVLRLLMTIPSGKARFNFVDPLSLGETFAGFMHLNDYKEELTGGRIATNSRQIEQHLSDLNEHMETVIQKYLRNEFENICDYNEAVGEIAEPFRFLVVADFPVNFTEDAVRRLVSIAKSGARCGVYLILHQDKRHAIPGGFDISDIEKQSINVEYLFGDLDWKNCGFKLADFFAEPAPEVSVMNDLIKKIGDASVNSNRVEIPFAKIKPTDKWTYSSAEDISAPIGLTGAKQQEITFGHGTNQHCLIAGKTGSGKSNLIHVIISNMAYKYSPEELEFYLI